MTRVLTKSSYVKYLWLLAVFGWACSPHFGPIQKAANQKNWTQALKNTKEEPVLQAHLAALIVEAEALSTSHPKPLVLALEHSSTDVSMILKRLAQKHRSALAGKMAFVVLEKEQKEISSIVQSYLTHENSELRALTATTLGMYFSDNQLERMLTDVEPIVRSAAVAALCKRTVKEDISQALLERLRLDPVPHVRAAAARCPFSLGNHAAIVLQQVIQTEKNAGVVKSAMEGLVQLDKGYWINFLTQQTNGPMTLTKIFASAILAKNGVAEGIARLKDALYDKNEFIRAKSISFVTKKTFADPAKFWETALKDSQRVAIAAAKQLLETHQHQSHAIKRLHEIWEAGDEEDAQEALKLLAQYGDKKALRDMETQLASRYISVSQIADWQTIHALRKKFVTLLDNHRPEIRLQAALIILAMTKE